MTREEIEQLAEKQWEGCHGCDESDKQFWINGFMFGYIYARIDNIDDKIDSTHKKIADILINTNEISYGKQS
jgi:hypothetical protein